MAFAETVYKNKISEERIKARLSAESDAVVILTSPPQMPKLYLTAWGSIPPIHGYLFNNTAREVMQSLSPAAGGLEGKIGQRHLVC